MASADRDSLIPAKPNRFLVRGFTWWTKRLFRKRFSEALVVRDSIPSVERLAEHPGPVIVALNHSSWWDPLTCLLLGDRWFPNRQSAAPMEREQLERFGFFRGLGVFGIDPDDPASLRAMRSHLEDLFAKQDRPTLWITPQAEFTDVRQPVRVRPGAPSVAASFPDARVLCAAIEYTFWQDQLPHVFVRFEACEAERDSTTGWTRAMRDAMQRNQDALAELVIARDPAPFDRIAAGQAGRVNPLYDLWLRIRGRGGSIEARRTKEQGT